MKANAKSLFTLGLVAAILTASVANAASGAVVIPVGDWGAAAVDWAGPIVAAGVAVMFRKLPSQLVAVLVATRVDQLLDKAVNLGLNSVRGAVVGKTLSMDTGINVLNAALDYAVRQAPTVVALAGGAERLKEKILARLHLDEDAALSPLKMQAQGG